jgi:hypothetical protein
MHDIRNFCRELAFVYVEPRKIEQRGEPQVGLEIVVKTRTLMV